MSSLKKSLFLSVFGAAMSGTVAFAADLPSPPVIEYEPEATVEIGSDWYLRGDLGYAHHQVGDVYWMDPVNGRRDFVNKHIGGAFMMGGGFGYYFNEHFRTDVTVDYRFRSKFKANVGGCGTCGSGYSDEQNMFSAWTLMLNGYYDFGSYGIVTPYVGAGVGMSYVTIDDYKTNAGTAFAGDSKANFAWNLQAGASFDVAEKVKLDTNYRFVSLGSAQTARHYVNGASATNPVKYEDLFAHEFRVGLRYDLN